MGLFDEIKNLAGEAETLAKEHPDQVKAALAKAEQVVDDQTGHKYTSQLQAGASKAESYLGGDDPAAATPSTPDAPATPSTPGAPAIPATPATQATPAVPTQ